MEQTKLSLSPQEFAIAANADLILTKNAVLQKVKTALDALHAWAIAAIKDRKGLPPASYEVNGKVSRGENYNGLPYVILDYPRNFKQEHVFAIRSMFWWGRQISCTLHLSGEWKALFSTAISSHFTQLQEKGFYLSYSGNEWDHDLLGSTYIPFAALTAYQLKQAFTVHPFIKIASFAPISELKEAPGLWRAAFTAFLEILCQEH